MTSKVLRPKVEINNISKSIVKYISLISFCLVLSACGFTLRGSQALPDHIDTVVLYSPIQASGLYRALQKRLPVYQLRGLSHDATELNQVAKQAYVEITLQPENLERQLLSVFSSGQVAEYELIYTVDYEVSFPNSESISNTLVVSREYQEDPRQILAKSRELELVLNEMRDESADRIIRLLSSQYSLTNTNAGQN